LLQSVIRLALVAGFAGFMATQSLISFFDIASKGAVSATADPQTKEMKWLFASQWSLPPAETSRVLIPGLYGYRMDSPNGAAYWGAVGASPGAPDSRFSGAGEYAGVLVVLLALWSLGQSFRRRGGPFTDPEKKLMWFWGATCLIAIVLGWGKFTPLYHATVYQLPYFSSIRNPMKFMHVAHLALMILFGYGLLGFSRKYLGEARKTKPGPAGPRASAAAPGSAANNAEAANDKLWRFLFLGLLALSAVGFMAYLSGKPGLIKYLETAGFNNPQLPSPSDLASFSVHEFLLFVVFMALSVGALLLIMRGFFAGPKAVWAAVVLGGLLTIDLGRANAPWIVYWNYPYKYATNPIIDVLKDKPYEARVVSPQFLFNVEALYRGGGPNYLFPSVYGIEWVQHHFQYYNIQSVDVAQDPRPPADKLAYMGALLPDPSPPRYPRYWQLTNTRYVLGMAGYLPALNQLDQGRNRFQIKSTFNVVPKTGADRNRGQIQMQDFTVEPATNGPLALFEYSGALPRAKLFARWQVLTNHDEVLRTLVDPSFDPWSAVLVSDEIPASPSVMTNADGGPVTFTHYAPQRIELKAQAATPSVLLLNDRFDPDWRVSVDGQPARLLRANFIMRGVQVPAGAHTIVFDFKPSLKGLTISLVAIGVSVVMLGLLLVVRQNGAKT
jgi:hypothetical protein